ncbi:MAG: pilin [bacterium]
MKKINFVLFLSLSSFLLILPLLASAAIVCTYEEGCSSQGQWCDGGLCVSCPSGYKNCDLKDKCECLVADGTYSCQNGYCAKVLPAYNCTDWVSRVCNVNNQDCKDKMYQTRICTPRLWDVESRCIDDPSCVSGQTTPTSGDTNTGANDSGSSECPPGQICNPLNYDNFGDLASAINNFIFVIAVALAPILFAIGGVMIVTAGGNPLQVQKAQKLMLYAAVGLVVILLAQAIVYVIRNVIGVKEEITHIPMIFTGLITSFRNLKFKRSK